MLDSIQISRSALTEEVRHDPNLARLFLYIINKIDDNGISTIDTTELNKVYGWTRQQSRTLIQRLKSTAKLTAKPTAKSTAFVFDNHSVKPNYQPQNQPHSQPHEQPQKTASGSMPSLDFGEQEAVPRAMRFKKPTVEEIRRYIAEKNYDVDAQYFFDYYESNGWKRGNTKMASWKHTLSNWNRNNFNNGTRTKATDQYTARRGTDVGNHTEADYGGPF